MINTKIYKSVYTLAEKLLEADRKGHQEAFNWLYSELKRFVLTMKIPIKTIQSNGKR